MYLLVLQFTTDETVGKKVNLVFDTQITIIPEPKATISCGTAWKMQIQFFSTTVAGAGLWSKDDTVVASVSKSAILCTQICTLKEWEDSNENTAK